MKNKVSIILPIYNQEKYLDISMPTVIKQTYKNLEIIAVNDGSTDKSAEILDRYAAQDSRIKIITKENGGLVDATLAGIHSATGEYVCFLDPDDYLDLNFISFFMDNIGDCDFVAAGFYRIDNGKITEDNLLEDKIYSSDEIEQYRTELWEPLRRFFISRWNKLYKLDCVKAVAKEFEKCKDVSLGEDTVFSYLMMLNARTGKTVRNANGYYYNVSSQTSMTSNSKNQKHLSQAKVAYETLSRLMTANGDDDRMAYVLYYRLVEVIIKRTYNTDLKEYKKLYCQLHKDKIFRKAIKYIGSSSKIYGKIKFWIWRNIPIPELLICMDSFYKKMKE